MEQKNFETIKIDQIIESPDVPNVRSDINKTDVRELMNSIKEHGVHTPLVVFKQNGNFVLVSGFRRKKAIEELQKEDPKVNIEVPVLIKTFEKTTDALYANLIENVQRKDVNGYDLAQRMKMLIDGGISKDDLKQKLSKSITWINQVLDILSAEPEVQNHWKKGEITMNEAMKIAKLPKDTQAIVAKGFEVANKEAKEGDKSSKKKLKKALDENITEKVRPSTKEMKYHRNLLSEISKEIKKQWGDKIEKDKTPDELKKHYVMTGANNMIKWVLGEFKNLNLEKMAKELGFEIGNDGFKAPEKKEKKEKKDSE